MKLSLALTEQSDVEETCSCGGRNKRVGTVNYDLQAEPLFAVFTDKVRWH